MQLLRPEQPELPGRLSRSRDAALVATFAAFTAALGLVPALAVAAVPITAQTLGPMLAGAVIGARRAFASQLLFLALVAIGLPLLAGGRGGLAVFAGPSVGYLVGWPLGACVVGWLTERGGLPYRLGWGLVANLVGGVAVIYALGIPGFAWRADLPIGHVAWLNLLFVPGDVAKAIIAALVARGVHAAYPGLVRRRERAAV